MTRGRAMLLALFLVSAAWGIGVLVGGPIHLTVGPVRLRSSHATRPLFIAAASALAYLVSGGPLPWAALGRRITPRAAAAVLAVCVGCVGLWVGPRAVGGPDPSGYASQARFWRAGMLPRLEQPLARDLPWSAAAAAMTPLGWTPSSTPGISVPTYAPGYPLTEALAATIGGEEAIFVVVPLLAALSIWLTFHYGRMVSGEIVGLASAAVLASSPAFHFMLMSAGPMSDIPTMAWWLAAAVSAMSQRRGPWPMLASGMATALAILTRPNLVALAPLVLVLALLHERSVRAWLVRGALWTLGALPGPIAVAWINASLYDSPLQSGYGDLGSYFALSHVVPNVKLYATWLLTTQTPLVLAGFAAPLLIARAGGPRLPVWRALWSLVFAGAVIAPYLAYLVFDEWWWALRFLLPAYPMLLVTSATTLDVASVRLGRWGRPCAACVLAAVCWHGVTFVPLTAHYTNARDHDRFREAATRALSLPANAVMLSMLHSGSLTYYAGVPTLRYDRLDPASLERVVAHFTAAGRTVYAVLEPGEVADVRARFAASARLDWLSTPVDVSPFGVRFYRVAHPSP